MEVPGLHFGSTHVSASSDTLCVLGRQSLENVFALCVRCFLPVREFADSLIRTGTKMYTPALPPSRSRKSRTEDMQLDHTERKWVNRDSDNVTQPPKCGVWLNKQTLVQKIHFSILFLLFSLPPPPTFPRSLTTTFFNFYRLNGIKASVHLGYVPPLVISRHCAILGIEHRV